MNEGDVFTVLDIKSACWRIPINEGDEHKTAFVQKQPPEVSVRKGVLRNFAKFTGKHLCQSLFFNKVAGLSPQNTFLQNNSGRLLLFVVHNAKYHWRLVPFGRSFDDDCIIFSKRADHIRHVKTILKKFTKFGGIQVSI